MKRKIFRLLPAVLVVGTALALVSGPIPAGAAAPVTATSADGALPACSLPAPGDAVCAALVHRGGRHRAVLAAGQPDLPMGYGPGDIQSAYRLAGAVRAGAGSGTVVAIVDAFDNPNAEADLAVYRSTYGLPPCTTDNGCFRKVNQTGQAAPLPRTDGGWSIEISLDLDMVSATCPQCHLLLVEGSGASPGALPTAAKTAVALGARIVSNSYLEFETDTTVSQFAADYEVPGVIYTAASGDTGHQLTAALPSSIPTVIAVGGTSLTHTNNRRGWTETAWSEPERNEGTGSGCSAYFDKPAWQHDTACPGRTVADVAAVADPRTGVARVRHHAEPGPPAQRLAGHRRHQCGDTDHRRCLRAGGQRGAANRPGWSVLASRRTVRRGQRQQLRAIQWRGMPCDDVHLYRQARVRRTDRARHPERHGGILTPMSHRARGLESHRSAPAHGRRVS